ncbi:MAG TPA: hypothetical protein VHQ90_26065 [Thermoanaerobaculia bacterium]|nr:hypothetical protein [Thermoanaerobaculia bacterium]
MTAEPERSEAAAALAASSASGRGWWLPLLLAVSLAGASFLAQGRIGFNIADEGFLWYGAVATAHGDVPLRDFYSYDPGRYYWAAAWARLLGDGILALRLSTAIFAAIGLWLGLLAARRVVTGPWALALAGAMLLAWMSPRHKLFEPSVAMAAVWAGARLAERPSRGRHFAAGVLVGLAGFLGKNLGLYCGAALLALILVRHFWPADGPAGSSPHQLSRPRGMKRRSLTGDGGLRSIGSPPTTPRESPSRFSEAAGSLPGGAGGEGDAPALSRREFRLSGLGSKLRAFAGGALAGFAPMLALLLVPGFSRAYLDSFLMFVRLGQTNAPVPFPWPWLALEPGADWLDRMESIATGASFLLLPIGTIALLALALARRRRGGTAPALLLAGGLVGACFLHHALSRSDTFHLTQSIHPLLLGLLAVPPALAAGNPRAGRWARAVLVPLLLVLTFCAAVPQAPLYEKLTPNRPLDSFVPHDVAGDELYLRLRDARMLDAVRRDYDRLVPHGAPMLLVPHFPGLYPILGLRSPVWEIYPVWPGEERDERMVRELQRKDVRWALVGLDPEDNGNPALAETHPKTWRYLTETFERLRTPGLPRRLLLLHRP